MKKIFLNFVVISAFLIVSIIGFSGLCTSADSKNISEKDKYLAEERKYTSKSKGYGYDNCVFFSYTQQEDSIYKLDLEANNYFYKQNIETKEISLLLKKYVSSYAVYKEFIYCVLEDNSIIRISHTGDDETFIFQGDSTITHLYVDSYEDIEVLYFVMDDTVYRYFINEKILDKLFYYENIYYIKPVSNYKIKWYFTDPEWIKYVEKTGDYENNTGKRTTFFVNYDVLNAKHIFLEEEQEYKYPAYKVEDLGLYTLIKDNPQTSDSIKIFFNFAILIIFVVISCFSTKYTREIKNKK